jgi:glycosyltransferase involved in cell wall biosynthesis
MAENVTRFIGNSNAVADRIQRFYGRRAQIIPPPVRTDFFTPGEEREDGFLYIGRLTGYKRPDLVVAAFRELPYQLTIVGGGAMLPALRAMATSNIEFLENVDDAQLRSLYRRARALVHPIDEDFGIAMAEAQACGTPVISLDAGGALDIVEHGRSGWLIRGRRVEDIRAAVRHAAAESLDPAEIRASAERFSAVNFRHAMRAAVNDMVGDPRRV